MINTFEIQAIGTAMISWSFKISKSCGPGYCSVHLIGCVTDDFECAWGVISFGLDPCPDLCSFALLLRMSARIDRASITASCARCAANRTFSSCSARDDASRAACFSCKSSMIGTGTEDWWESSENRTRRLDMATKV